MSARGFSDRDTQRITDFVVKTERSPAGSPGQLRPRVGSRVRRVVLDGDLLFSEAATGREQVQQPDGSWATTDVVVQDIYNDSAELRGLGEDDAVLIVPQGGRWYAFADAGRDDSGNAAGCCSGCVDQRYLLVAGLYASQYRITKIPAELGGPVVTLDFIGLTSGLPGITDGFYYWESDTFDYECDDGSDTYFWRMVVRASAASTCRAAWGANEVYLYLVRVGSAADCTDLTEPFCGGGDCPTCPDATVFTISIPFFFTNGLFHQSGCVWGATGTYIQDIAGSGSTTISFVASFNLTSGVFTLTLTNSVFGTCTATYNIAAGDAATCNGDFGMERTAQTGICSAPLNGTMTAS